MDAVYEPEQQGKAERCIPELDSDEVCFGGEAFARCKNTVSCTPNNKAAVAQALAVLSLLRSCWY